MNFVEQVLYLTKDSEAPRKYFYWSSLSAIAAVVSREVYIQRQNARLYPNIYVLIIGRSGLRKGAAINLARFLVDAVDNTKVYAGRSSIQGIISDLSKTSTKKDQAKPVTSARGYLVASEFASTMVKDPDAMTILTDLYDTHYHKVWSYMLRNSPTETLKEPYINMLGASNEIHLKDAIPDNAIGGGFIARTFMIYADKKAKVNAGLRKAAVNGLQIGTLVETLNDIAKCKGPFVITEEAIDYYDAWYERLQLVIEDTEDPTGTLERLHDHVLKVAMLLSLSRSRDLDIDINDMKESVSACADFAPAARRVQLFQAGKSASAPGTMVLLTELIRNPAHEISRTEALSKHWAHFNHTELDVIAESLYAQKGIKLIIKKDEHGRPDTFYVLNPDVLKRYKERQEI